MNEQITTLLPEVEPAAGGVPAPAVGVDYDWVVGQFYEALYKFAFGLTGSESDAADLTQETYRVLLTKGDSLRDAAKVEPWLFKTMHRQFLGWRRQAAHPRKAFFRAAERKPTTLTTHHAPALEDAHILKTLQQLEEKFRAPLTLFYLGEFSSHEMADVLDLPLGTLLLRLERGKELGHRRLQETPPTPVRDRDFAWMERFQGSALPCPA